jgi:serine/threonine-protein kinase HipA
MSAYQVSDELALWWLAEPAHPRLVGTLRHLRRTARQPGGVSLEYSPDWLASGRALSEDLPLQPGEFLPVEADAAAGAVDDARPDRWGERVIRLIDRPPRLSTLEYLYFAGDDRFGALGVSTSATQYLPRRHGPLPTLSDLQTMHDLVRQVEAGDPVPEQLRRLVSPGATLGGARPKALLNLDGTQWVVKFGEAGDPLDGPLVEHAAMTLAAHAGIDVCATRPLRLQAGHAVAVRRFDRIGASRVHAVSAHAALRAAGQEYGYPELALLLRRRGEADAFAAQGEQLFRRMLFNILIDNTDDHEKNHALIESDARRYRLSPAFDVLPSGQALGYQQMRVGREGADATIANALSEHRAFALTREHAQSVCADVAQAVRGWRNHFRTLGVSARDIDLLAQQIDREFLRAQRDAGT